MYLEYALVYNSLCSVTIKSSFAVAMLGRGIWSIMNLCSWSWSLRSGFRINDVLLLLR